MIRQEQAPALLHSASDLTHFLACEALTALDLRSLFDAELTKKKVSLDDSGQLVADKGMAHEKAHLQRLVDQGKRVVDINTVAGRDLAERAQATQRAMADGADVVYQATLVQGDLLGHADFLLKVDTPSSLGPWSYEVADTKLALHVQAKFLVQLSFYSHLLQPLQGTYPEHMQVVLGDQSIQNFRCQDYTHYTQALLQRYRATVQALQHNPLSAAYPLPCEHCDLCHWREHCAQQRLDDDHLCQVAGIRKQQIIKLQDAGIHTLTALAQHPPEQRVPRMQANTLLTLQRQASLQARAKADGQLHHQLIPVVPGSLRGFERLPEPNEGDIYFDMEGDPLYAGGLEYLFGLWAREQGAHANLPSWTFKAFWAHNRQEEKRAFEDCIDFIEARRLLYPGLHVYHYANYEERAFKDLSNAHGTREVEVDDLLRHHVLVDLYRVVKEGLCISQPSYSIKYVEHFYRPARQGDVQNAGASIVNYERWRETQDPQLLQDIEAYNRDDVQSTQQLHCWLLTLKPTDVPWFGRGAARAPDAASDESAQSSKARALTVRIEDTAQRLTQNLPTDPTTWAPDERMRHLTAQLLGFYRRSDKPVWWNLFSKAYLTDDELLEDPECLACLTLDPQVKPAPSPKGGKPKTRYTYIAPEQDSKISGNTKVSLVHSGRQPISIEFNPSTRRVTLDVPTTHDPLPEVLHLGPDGPLENKSGQEALFTFAEVLLASTASHQAIQGLLKREPPHIKGLQPGQPLVAAGQDPVQAAVQCALHLDRSYLYVQGPPGAGKTYTGSHMIAALLAQGRKVGVLSNSHKAINHLMQGALQVAQEQGTRVRAVKKASDDADTHLVAPGHDVVNVTDNDKVLKQGGNLIGGTAWFFSRLSGELDTLFVDEAGQVALANLVACAGAARNLVLLGDQMQLGQPVQGVHPGHSGDSALDYLLNGAATIAPDHGIFLPTSWRMHPDVCSFISQAVYEGRLHPEPGNAKRTLVLGASAHPALKPSGLGFLPVQHQGCSQQSQAEAQLIHQIFNSALQQRYTTTSGQVHPMTAQNILVVAPYNLQVQLLQRTLPAGARVGTVDKFQGQEAELVLMSMTTSSQEDLPRHVEFLYSKNRLNVALSRAKCTALLVASPALLAIKCAKPEEMALVNTLCWVGEWAGG